jgi:hypothetical protein
MVEKMTILVEEYIKTAFSSDDAEKINPIINQAVASNDKVTIDFTGITFYTTLFFSFAMARFICEIGSEKYDETFQVVGLTEIGLTAYKHSLDIAREECKLTPEQKQARIANSAAKRGENMQKELNRFSGDIAFFTQPNINSSAGRAFTNYRKKLYDTRIVRYWLDKAYPF